MTKVIYIADCDIQAKPAEAVAGPSWRRASKEYILVDILREMRQLIETDYLNMDK